VPQPRLPERGQPPKDEQQHPWRVEGHRGEEPQKGPGGGKPASIFPSGRRFWLILLALLAVNIAVSAVLSRPAQRLDVPYTFFRAEIVKGNVADVTSRGDDIQGDFKQKVKFPATGKNSKTSKEFKTVRPSFGDDGLLTLMLDKNVTVNAKPLDKGTPLWQTIVFGFGPTLLLVGLFIFFIRRSAAG
jgi:cell division protease FtsH